STPRGRTRRCGSGPAPTTAARTTSPCDCGRRAAPHPAFRSRRPDRVPSSLHRPRPQARESIMRDFINHAVFGWYPYLCLTVFLVGSWLRFDREQYTWRSGSSQLLRRRQLMWGSNLFHVGILLIFMGHFVGLLTPGWVFDTLGISHTFKQWMAIVIGGVAGVICFVGMTMLIHRRLFDARIRTTSSFGDIAVLLLIYVQLLL